MQVDCALSLIRLGVERNISGLRTLCDNLVTLETLVYETGADITLSLKDLQQMKDIEKLRLLMVKSSDERYVKDAYQWMVPFLHRCENQTPGVANELLKEYLVTLAKEDLKFPLKIIEHSKPACQQKIISDQDFLMITALECIYSCKRDDQLSLCYDILECLPQRGYGPETAITKNLHDQVDELEQILSVSELMEKHGLQKPISFVKETQNSPEEARKLMIRLTRHTGRKQPPVNEAHWMGLLQDMLEMRQNIYTCLSSDTCYEIFTESLLCSSRLENIHLAGQMMHCSVWSIDPPVSVSSKSKPQYRVCYQKSIELVLAASREYFNSSTSLTDPCMDLSRSCLQLITDCPAVIQEELDLIRGLGYLEEFGVKILPLQVRLRSDRLSLIKECLLQLPTNYKQSAKLLGLANLLRVAGDDQKERKGQVLILLVEQALQFQDYKAANMHCQELMASGYTESWEVCSQLGQSEGYQDMAIRQELIAYALTHCPPSAIESLLAASSTLQTEILYHAVNYQIHPSEKGENVNTSRPSVVVKPESPQEVDTSISPSQSADLLQWTTAKTMKVLSDTTLTTKAMLHAVSDRQWWKKSLTYLRPLHGQELGDVLRSTSGANATIAKQGCHPFYESLIDEPYVADNEVTYTSYQHNPLESFAEVLLRTGKLAETKSEGHDLFPATEVLLQLASEALPNDMTLALAYLLALPQVVDANKCFEKQPPSALSLQLASYYYSLQIYAHLAPCFKDKCHPLYRGFYFQSLVQLVDLVKWVVAETTKATTPQISTPHNLPQREKGKRGCDRTPSPTASSTSDSSSGEESPSHNRGKRRQFEGERDRFQDLLDSREEGELSGKEDDDHLLADGGNRLFPVDLFPCILNKAIQTFDLAPDDDTKSTEAQSAKKASKLLLPKGTPKPAKADPKELIQMVTVHVTQSSHTDWSDEIATLIKHLQYYNERLSDFTQAQTLQGLGKGVDVQRFTADPQYKRETILGLAETLEENVYRIALSLAQRYNVPLWEVYMTHLEFLFSDSGLTTAAIEDRAQSLGLFETLKTIPEAFHEHMAKYVYPTIEGRDHQRLLYYFTLLENCACPEVVNSIIKPETHIRLLKKFKAVAPGLNYKKLTEENACPLEALGPVLTSQNILSISKLAPKIPEKDGRMLSPSSVYLIWLKTLFWNGDAHLIKKAPETVPEWLRAYDICAKYYDRLCPGDIIIFMDEITFSSRAVTKLSVDSRVEMTKKAIKTVKHVAEKAGKRAADEDDAEGVVSRHMSYEDALSHLQQSLAHLETLSHSFISFLKNSDQNILQEYGHQYDLSRSEKEKINEQAVTMCLDGQPLAMIKNLLDVAVGDLRLSPRDIVQTAVNKIVRNLSGNGEECPFKKDPLQILEGIVSAVRTSAENGENLVSSDDLLDWFRPFCGDDSLPVKPRIQVLQILEQTFHLSDEDSKLLVLFRTQAVLKAFWPQTQVEIADIENEEKRYSLFLELLDSSENDTEFQPLVMLLQAWPPMKSISVVCPSNNPWVKLGTAMLVKCQQGHKENMGNEILKIYRSLYGTKHMLSPECIKDLCLLLLNQSLLLPALKLLVESRDQDLHAVALEQITAVAKVDDSSCDPELLSLLLDENLVVKCVPTLFYPHLVNHLLARQEEGRWDAEEIAKQLQAAGFPAEAGSLLMASKGTHSALRTFGAALSAVRHWF
ncbi:hypothetical protein lerEdw1_008735 [Lerista edwardsae]|nr:hypothetical protein lerEdw1_008735 [Lerista edwardsae]